MTLPHGYYERAATLEDAEAVAELTALASRARGYPQDLRREDVLALLSSPDFDRERSTRLVHLEDGTLVGAAYLYEPKTPVYPRLTVEVHPQHRDSGVERALYAWGEDRAREAVDRAPDGARVAVRSAMPDADENAAGLLRELAFVPVRHFFRMVADFSSEAGARRLEQLPTADDVPEDMKMRTYRHPADLEALIAAHEATFRDHWGHVEEPHEYLLRRWKHRLESDPLFDPELFFLALTRGEGEIGGYCYCRIEEEGAPEFGYVAVLGVAPPYRRRGLGRALLGHGLRALYERGKRKVSLVVDSASLTGATRLYEELGMQVAHSFTVWEKELRAGAELSRT